jgi:hypothetical protein
MQESAVYEERPFVCVGNPAFCFENALNESIEKLLIANEGLSPSSTPSASRNPSPAPMPLNAFAPPAPNASMPKADSLSGGDKLRDKKRGHANRRNRRRSQQLAKPGQLTPPEIRPSIARKYIQQAVGIPTPLEADKFPAASGAFVATRGLGRKKVYKLEELVGKDAKIPFKLVPWDGK